MCSSYPIKVYTFDAVTSVNQILFTMPATRSFSLYEEGSLHRKPRSFLLQDQFKLAEQQELHLPGETWRFFASGVINDNIENFYTFSPEAFQGAPVTNVKNLDLARSLAGSKKIGTVLALDGYESDLEAGRRMHQAAGWLSEHAIGSISLKAHPATLRKQQKRWTSFLRSQGFRVEIVSESIILEAELAANNIDLLAAWGSSALAVAHDLRVGVHDFLLDMSEV